uniref:AD domain-containing protein n=1 Tax=Grammatophora oceanica TaxID=210454 RepID=A0A7S1UTI4_9STRA|mmetsp:Transcript_22271/g.33154  ORF Transcript_22271/g.33154 Transcript_22271/m.33154 type:complete len:200 (+) Transcript_22271:129-728(+)
MPELHVEYPANKLVELTVNDASSSEPTTVVTGRVYCTDPTSGVVVLQKALVHTTLACEMQWILASTIVKRKILEEGDASDEDAATKVYPLSTKLDVKSLEDKEKRALKLAREALEHINIKATPEGQAVFDRLVKACNEVVWHSNESSIVVLGQVRVDPPYNSPDCCHLLRNGSVDDKKLAQGCLERVQRIVSAIATSQQ